jgi:hypothetical protein
MCADGTDGQMLRSTTAEAHAGVPRDRIARIIGPGVKGSLENFPGHVLR